MPRTAALAAVLTVLTALAPLRADAACSMLLPEAFPRAGSTVGRNCAIDIFYPEELDPPDLDDLVIEVEGEPIAVDRLDLGRFSVDRYVEGYSDGGCSGDNIEEHYAHFRLIPRQLLPPATVVTIVGFTTYSGEHTFTTSSSTTDAECGGTAAPYPPSCYECWPSLPDSPEEPEDPSAPAPGPDGEPQLQRVGCSVAPDAPPIPWWPAALALLWLVRRQRR